MVKLMMPVFAICLAGHAWLGQTLGLSVDEAHYALYALHPALSYFDHPPLVGWVQMPFVWAGGADWMLRVMPFLLWSLTVYLLFIFPDLTPRSLCLPEADKQVGAFDFVVAKDKANIRYMVAGLFVLSPVYQLLGLALLPDTLLLPLTIWVMVLTWRLSLNSSCVPCWLWLGLALGLAGLSKYTGVFLALGSAIFLLSTHGWALLKRGGVWLTTLVAALLVSPVLIWNAKHDWVSFAYQLAHANGGINDWEAKRVLAYSLTQLVAYGALPLLGLLVFCLRLRKAHPAAMRLCLAFGLPPLLITLYLSSKGAALPHWTAGAWLALLPLCAIGLRHIWHNGAGSAGQALRVLVLGLGGLQALLIVALSFTMAMGGHWNNQALVGFVATEAGNPFADLHDWQAASLQARALQSKHQAAGLAVSNWTLASRLAWYARAKGAYEPATKVWALDDKNTQFNLWFESPKSGQLFIWLNWSQMPLMQPKGCRPLGGADGTYMGAHSSFDFYLCSKQ